MNAEQLQARANRRKERIYDLLRKRQDEADAPYEPVYISLRGIMAELHISQSYISNCLRELEAEDRIAVLPGNSRRPNGYWVRKDS